MTEHLHPDSHFDADHVAAFVEGALTDRERAESFVHLAGCYACRKLVFLAQEPLPYQETVAVAEHVPFWRRLAPLAFGSLAVAGGVIALVITLKPNAPPPNLSAGVTRAPVPLPSTPPPASVPSPVPHPAARTTPVERPALPAAQPSAQPSIQPPAAVAAAPLAQAAQSSVQDLPLNGRSVTSLSQLSNEKSAMAAPTLPTAAGPLALRIEHAQSPLGALATVQGAVLDASGASIPGATVTLRQPNAVTKQTQTDPTGHFAIANLPAGHYDLQITAQGFQAVTRAVDLQANDLALLTSELPIGSVAETVDVVSSAPMLQTESASTAMVTSLPGDHTLTSTVSQGKLTLALDPEGTVYLSTNNGKRWKKIKPSWSGRITNIDVADHGGGFEITTDAGVVWISQNGKRWSKQ